MTTKKRIFKTNIFKFYSLFLSLLIISICFVVLMIIWLCTDFINASIHGRYFLSTFSQIIAALLDALYISALVYSIYLAIIAKRICIFDEIRLPLIFFWVSPLTVFILLIPEIILMIIFAKRREVRKEYKKIKKENKEKK